VHAQQRMLCGAGTNTLVPAHSRCWVTQAQVQV